MFTWTDDAIRWYRTAAEKTEFFKRLTDKLAPFLPKEETVCDLGCGPGHLALELAARGYRVTALDASREAIAWLQTEKDRRCWEQPFIRCEDWNQLEGLPLWDNVVMVCAGRRTELSFLRKLCRKRLIIVDRVACRSHVRTDGGNSAHCRSVSVLRRYEKLAVARLSAFRLEFGQPLRSLADAEAYVRFFGGQCGGAVARGLIAADDEVYPWYFPYAKELEAFVLPSFWAEKEEEMTECIH